MGTSKKCFSSNTTFSTDVLQHEYIISIYIFYTYIFQIRSKIHDGRLQFIFVCNLIAFCPCVGQVVFQRGWWVINKGFPLSSQRVGGALAENIKASLRQRPCQPIGKEEAARIQKTDLNTKYQMIQWQRKKIPKQIPDSVRHQCKHKKNCTNSQSIIYLTGLTNIYQEKDCLTTKIPLKKKRTPALPTLTFPFKFSIIFRFYDTNVAQTEAQRLNTAPSGGRRATCTPHVSAHFIFDSVAPLALVGGGADTGILL